MPWFHAPRPKKRNGIRPVVFSLKWKIALLVSVLLIGTVWIVSAFIIRHENDVLNSRLEDTMRVYLETFRKNVEILLIQKGDKDSLNRSLDAYRNIRNFRMAMFVDNGGRILIHTDPRSLGLTVPRSDLRKFRAAFEDRVHFDRFETAETLLPEAIPVREFERNVAGRLRTDAERKTLNRFYEKNASSGMYELRESLPARDRTRAKTLVAGTGYLVWKGFDGFMPFYHPLILSDSQAIAAVGRAQDDFRAGKIFRSASLPEESRNNFEFYADLAAVCDSLFGKRDTNIATPELSRVFRKAGLTEDDAAFMKEYRIGLADLLEGREFVLDDATVLRLADLMKKSGLPSGRAAAHLIRRQKKTLFNRDSLLTPETRKNLAFIRFLELFLERYLDRAGRPTAQLEEFVGLFRGGSPAEMSRKYGWAPARNDYIAEFGNIFTRNYYRGYFRELSRAARNLSVYRTKSVNWNPENVEKLFSDILGIYRLGTVRIVLDLKKLQTEQKDVRNRTLDISAMVILRALLATVIIATILIAPLARLSEGTDALAAGNLERKVEVRARDEIGQLADKFNLMAGNLKKAFAEIRDKARMEEELKNAREIQEAILPREFPRFPGFSFAVSYRPQSESGGDYYDFIEMDESRFGVVVADVTGHGVGAGMVMAMLRSALRGSARKRLDASRALKDVNPGLFRDTLPAMFATVFYGVVDVPQRRMYYTVAGHPPGLLFNPADGQLRLLQGGGMPVGMVDSQTFDPAIELYQVTFAPGELLVLYSDGVTEAKNAAGEEYGEERLIAAVRGVSGAAERSPERVRDALLADVNAFAAGEPPSDDLTVLVMGIG